MMLLEMALAPEQASVEAGQVDAIFYSLLVICSLMALGVAAAILYFSIKYRRGSRADRSHPIRNTLGVELTWTLIPIFVFLGLFVWSARVFIHMSHPPADALQVYVVGKQWMWKFEHPGGQREINTLHVPVGRPVRLTMISQDVIHDVFVPAFRIHHDVLPGHYTSEWFTPSKVGRYHLFCSQYCGTGHAVMDGWVEVMAPDAFQSWLIQGAPQDSLISEGENLFNHLGCSGCHGAGSTVHAPNLAGLYGKPVPLEGGGFAIADDQYLLDSILQPGKQVAAGYPNIMPSFQGQISEDQVLALVGYLRSLDRGERTSR